MKRFLMAIFVIMIIMIWGVSPVGAERGVGRAKRKSPISEARGKANSAVKKATSTRGYAGGRRAETRQRGTTAEAKARPYAATRERHSQRRETRSETRQGARNIRSDARDHRSDRRGSRHESRDAHREFRSDVRKHRGDVRDSRRETRDDYRDFRNDVRKHRSDVRDSRRELRDDHRDFRGDVREHRSDVRDSRHELRDDYRDFRGDVHERKSNRAAAGNREGRIKRRAAHLSRKHEHRIDRLNHFRQVASEQGNDALVVRIDRTIDRENSRFDAAKQKISDRINDICSSDGQIEPVTTDQTQ